MGRIKRAVIAVVSAFVVGLVGTVLVATQAAASDTLMPDDDTVVATVLVLAGIGAVCAVIGTAVHSRPEALLAGSVGLVLGVVQLQSHTTLTALATAIMLTVLALTPYLAGFGVITLVTSLVTSGPRRTP